MNLNESMFQNRWLAERRISLSLHHTLSRGRELGVLLAEGRCGSSRSSAAEQLLSAEKEMRADRPLSEPALAVRFGFCRRGEWYQTAD